MKKIKVFILYSAHLIVSLRLSSRKYSRSGIKIKVFILYSAHLIVFLQTKYENE